MTLVRLLLITDVQVGMILSRIRSIFIISIIRTVFKKFIHLNISICYSYNELICNLFVRPSKTKLKPKNLIKDPTLFKISVIQFFGLNRNKNRLGILSNYFN